MGRAQDPEKRGGGGIAPVPSASSGAQVLLVTGMLAGNLEPCHCSEGMLGGLPRRASLVLRFGGKLPLLDMGDFARPTETSDTLMELRERGALEAIETIPGSLHVVALGCTDARLGLARLEKLAREAAPSVTWLCANVKNGPAFLKPSVETGDIIITAVLDPGLAVLDQGELVPPREAIAPLAARGKTLVVLFHGDPQAARALGDLPGISVIVSCHVEVGARTARLPSGASLVTLEQNGQKLHALALAKGALETEAAHPLDGLLPDAPAAREALDRFYEKATAAAPDLPRRKIDGEGGKYIGSRNCKICHEKAYAVWEKTGHARSLEKLKEKEPRRSALAECVECHVTGFGFETGWTKDASHLASVGCESCHGVASNHVDLANSSEDVNGFGMLPGKGPEGWRARCILCHDPLNSPSFDLETYLEKIKHWESWK